MRVFEQAFGRPVDTADEIASVADPLQIAQMTANERAQLLARVLEVHPQLIELVPARLRTNGER